MKFFATELRGKTVMTEDGQILGIRITAAVIISKFKGTPTRTKAVNLEPPGPKTIMWVW